MCLTQVMQECFRQAITISSLCVQVPCELMPPLPPPPSPHMQATAELKLFDAVFPKGRHMMCIQYAVLCTRALHTRQREERARRLERAGHHSVSVFGCAGVLWWSGGLCNVTDPKMV